MRKGILLASAVAILTAGCAPDERHAGEPKTLTVVVNAPFSRTPYVGETIARGVELAVAELEARGIDTDAGAYRLEVLRLDTALSPRRAVANVRRAIEANAIAVVDEGTGIGASWQLARDANLPICITYQGGVELVDVDERPNVFRIAPTDRGVAFRFAEYLLPKKLRVALLLDDSGYAQEAKPALDKAFGDDVASRLTLPSNAPDFAPQVLRARRSGATALLVWARAPVIAKVVAAARGSGWDVPVYTPPSGEDPILRQQLADHPEWVDGITFASGRMTAEVGAEPWYAFAEKYDSAYGPEPAGVRTRSGDPVLVPPDYAMYSYDFVNVLVAAIIAAGGAEDRSAVLSELNEVTVGGANGDERGFNERNHEGVVDDDVYFARFHDMTFAPVNDDPLSSTLPAIAQVR